MAETDPYDAQLQRLMVSPAAIISLNKAAQLLPLAARDARAWLRRNGLVRDIDGRAVVVWADVVDFVRAPPVRRASLTSLPREPL